MAFLRETLLFIIGSLTTVYGVYPYHGKLIQSGWGGGATHDLAGTVYAVDANRFQVIGFSFDGVGAEFVLGSDKTYAEVKAGGGADSAAVPIANPLGQRDPLRRYDNEDVILTLPSGKMLSDYKYIAVGDRTSKVLYGGVEILASLEAPAPKKFGRFSTRAHDVTSGDVTILNDRMIEVKAMRYDGQGPDAFFYVGTTASVVAQSAPYGKIPDENGVSDRKARAYSDRDIILTLPNTISATDLRWLSMYCISYNHNFGEVFFSGTLNVPPYVSDDAIETQNQTNCEPLSDKLQVSWTVSSDTITIQLAGNIDRNTDYMAFGLSGRDNSYAMINSDVVVADYKEGREPRAVDYFITGYAQCAGNGGACPDTAAANAANDDVMMPAGSITNGITRVTYKRALSTGDISKGKDKVYKIDGTAQQVVWAIGPLNNKDEAAKHYPGDRISSAKAINFARAVADNCPAFKLAPEKELPGFTAHHLYGREGVVFTAEIGQSASVQGYKAITGNPSWGIAWYINGVLIPELHLKRGVAYTFRVGGGTNPADGSKYHPFYFTDNELGGYQQTSNGTIYKATVNGKGQDHAVGDYCEWKLSSNAIAEIDNGKVYKCFEEYKQDLYRDCDKNNTRYTEFVFTPTASTPDLIYYQCYTHQSLGWKVHIYDELPATEIAANDCTASKIPTTALHTTEILQTTMETIPIPEPEGTMPTTKETIPNTEGISTTKETIPNPEGILTTKETIPNPEGISTTKEPTPTPEQIIPTTQETMPSTMKTQLSTAEKTHSAMKDIHSTASLETTTHANNAYESGSSTMDTFNGTAGHSNTTTALYQTTSGVISSTAKERTVGDGDSGATFTTGSGLLILVLIWCLL